MMLNEASGLNESELLIKSITEEPNYAIGEEITLRGAGVIGRVGYGQPRATLSA